MERRILLLVTDLEIGGTPTVAREVASRLHNPPWVNIHVACLAKMGPVGEQIKKYGVSVTALGACCAADLRVIGRLARLIHSERIDTVLSFLLHANAAAALVATANPHVKFFQSIQTTQPNPRWHWKVQRFAAHMAEKIAVPSPSVADAAGERSGISREKIIVIPNGVDLPPSLPPPAEAQLPHRIVFLGRLDPIKRLPDLLAAMTRLRGFAHLDIFGEGSERTTLEQQIQTLDLASEVSLRGAAASPHAALAAAELLVLPSEAEGFGLVLIEAMSAGVPVVVTNAPGVRDVVRDGQTGLLVPVGDPPALAEAIRRVLDDPGLRQSLTRSAFADVRERFTWDAAMAGYRSLLGT